MERTIFLVYSNTYSRVSKMLNVFMKEEYTHISIGFNAGIDKLYSFGRKNFYFPVIGGFIEEDTVKGVFSNFKETQIEVLEKKVTTEEYERLRKEIEKYKILSNLYKYNFRGLPLMWLNIPYERERHFVCSQFVGYLLSQSGIHTFNKSWSLLQPKDMREIEGLKTIYKGRLEDFINNTI